MDIRELRSIGELHAVEAMQKEVWGVADLEVLPAIHMIAAREVGAILLGAFRTIRPAPPVAAMNPGVGPTGGWSNPAPMAG